PQLERITLSKLYSLDNEIRSLVESFNYNGIITLLKEFCNDLSNVYFDAKKDSLYCDSVDSKERKVALFVLDEILKRLCAFLQPIIPFTVYEVMKLRNSKNKSYLLSLDDLVSDNSHVHDPKIWDRLKKIRSAFTMELDRQKKEGLVKINAECDVI